MLFSRYHCARNYICILRIMNYICEPNTTATAVFGTYVAASKLRRQIGSSLMKQRVVEIERETYINLQTRLFVYSLSTHLDHYC